MATKDRILAWVKKHGAVKSSELVKPLGVSRQTLASHFSSLVQDGVLVKVGSTRNATYSLNKRRKQELSSLSNPQTFKIIRKLKGLEEDRVCNEIFQKLSLTTSLSPKAQTIFRYTFTEMLNNAIDHSNSPESIITVSLFSKDIEFIVKDKGVGIFKRVQKTFKLANEFDGLEHVLKGKQTTQPQKHTGEGIFFTSRIADIFSIKSHSLSVRIDNKLEETFVKNERFEQGTEVRFRIHRKTRKSLSDLFNAFTNEDRKFDRNEIRVIVSAQAGNLSRSEAKRLLFGLEKFSRITFDFKGVKEIGQGFADEIFRVYAVSHPTIKLSHENTCSAVEFMIDRVQK